MQNQCNWLRDLFVCLFVFYTIFLLNLNTLSAEEINWTKVANTNNQIQFIDTNSIKYNDRGLLSVMTKYSKVNPDDQTIITTDSYLLAIDCESRLYSKLPINSSPKQVKKWTNSINDKLIKTTIIKSCSY